MVIRPPPPRDHRAAITAGSLEVTEVAFAEMLYLPLRDSICSILIWIQNTAGFI
jgi:hypothetical protein